MIMSERVISFRGVQMDPAVTSHLRNLARIGKKVQFVRFHVQCAGEEGTAIFFTSISSAEQAETSQVDYTRELRGLNDCLASHHPHHLRVSTQATIETYSKLWFLGTRSVSTVKQTSWPKTPLLKSSSTVSTKLECGLLSVYLEPKSMPSSIAYRIILKSNLSSPDMNRMLQ